MPTRMTPRDFAFLMAINTIWGLNFIFVKTAVEAAPPLFVNMIRFLMVIAICFPFLRWIPGRMKAVFGVSFLLGVMHFGVMFTAMSVADDISVLAITSQLGVPFSTLLAIAFLDERIGWKRTFGICLAFGGVVIIAFEPRVLDTWLALVLGIVTAFFYAAAAIFMRRLRGVKPLEQQAWIAFVAVPFMALATFVFEGSMVPHFESLNAPVIGAIAYSAIFSSIIAHGGMFYLLQRYPVTTTQPLTLLMPVIAVIAGVVFLGDVLTWKIALGGLVALFGVLIIMLRTAPRPAGGTI
ncbi:MAG: DMT family transporter [Pseudomonadota bacterium]